MAERMVNPFAGFNANLMEDDEIIRFWITPGPLSDLIQNGAELISSPPIFFMGGRGCGKTMILKYMSNEIQIKRSKIDNISKNDFLANLHYIGVYNRFDGPSLSIFEKRNLGDTEWETIFKHYMEIVICKKYVQMLENLKANEYLDVDENTIKKLIRDLDKYIFESSESDIGDTSFEILIEKLESLSKKVFKFINNAPFNKNPKFESEFIFSSGYLIFGVPKIINNIIPSFKRKKFVILLDEYENASRMQQLIINTLIKHVQPPVTFVIGSRFYGLKTFDTMNKDEFLMEDADFRTISFEDVVSDKDYFRFIRAIADKRLEEREIFKNRNNYDIEKILGKLTPEMEARKIVFGKENNKDTSCDFDTYKKKKHVVKLHEILSVRIKNDNLNNVDTILKNLISIDNPLIDILSMVLIIRGKYSLDELQIITQSYLKQKKGSPSNAESEIIKTYDDLYSKNKLALVFQLNFLLSPNTKRICRLPGIRTTFIRINS